jgi:hypothetical protein
MQTHCSDALKEWAVVCAALQTGRQTILLRAGGIAERPGGFSVEHSEFWLFPTRFHQSADELVEDAALLLEQIGGCHVPEGLVRLRLYARVAATHHLSDPSQLERLEGLHILSPDTVRSRFDYRRPGLFVLTLRVCCLPEPLEIVDAPQFAGCHSWVDLQQSLPTDGLQPVLSDDEFAAQLQEIQSRLDCDTPQSE